MATLFVDKVDPQSGTSLEIGSSGDTITIPSGATLTNNGTATGFGSDFTPNFLSYMSTSNQALSSETLTLVTFNTESYDSDSAFNTSTYKFTIPSNEAGKYVLYFQIRRSNFAGARFFGTIVRTRSGSESELITAEANGGSDAYDTVYSMVVTDCLVGDTFHVRAKHFDSGSRSIYGGIESSFFGGYKLI